MAALTADFDSPIQNVRAQAQYTAATGTVLFTGGLVQLDGSGLAIAAINGSTNQIVGRATMSLDGTEPAGTIISVEEGDIFLNLAGASDPVQADVGSQVYAANDNAIDTVNTNAIAGILIRLATGPLGTSGAYVRCTLEANR